MNWLFEAYSNVYNTAMMQDVNSRKHIAPAKDNESECSKRR